jgi:hypothetical protein
LDNHATYRSHTTLDTAHIHWSSSSGDLTFDWDLVHDRVRLIRDGATRWRGSLFPSFLLQGKSGLDYASASCCECRSLTGPEAGWELALDYPGVAKASLHILQHEDGFSFREFTVTWKGETRKIHSLFFGVSPLSQELQNNSGYVDRPHFPDWVADGFCVPSAKPGPIQSFFHSFSFGHCCIPLGSFGPSMGIPYAAAFPRPILSVAVGGRDSWCCLGAGEIPDAALSLKVEASNGCLEWRYREDLWGAPEGRVRTWKAPLEITFADSAYTAFATYFDRFPCTPRGGRPPMNFDVWGSWGEFKEGVFDLDAFSDRVQAWIGAGAVILDEGWESPNTSKPYPGRFPDFNGQLDRIRDKGLDIILWQSIGWIDDPANGSLAETDLLLSTKGTPVCGDWKLDPRTSGVRHFYADPSSPNSRAYLEHHVRETIEQYHPEGMKLDFGYGLPGPDHSAPADPAFRGEQAAWWLMKIASDAAAATDSGVRLIGYALHPLYHEFMDILFLDDLGDCGHAEAAGHGQWTVWASLAGPRGMAINGSSGYQWTSDNDILLNSAILGAPGTNLRLDQHPSPRVLLQRRALHRWYRRTIRWEPLWLDSETGGLSAEPHVRSLGRMESLADGPALTALALRRDSQGLTGHPFVESLEWTGNWALIAQDDRDLAESRHFVCIPVGGDARLCLPFSPDTRIVAVTPSGDRSYPTKSGEGGRVTLGLTPELAEDCIGFEIRT